MKKVKLFFAAAALLLVTAGVFAGKSRFAVNPPNLYYLNATHYYEIATAVPSGILEYNVSGATQLEITAGTPYLLYTYISGATPAYQPVSFQ